MLVCAALWDACLLALADLTPPSKPAWRDRPRATHMLEHVVIIIVIVIVVVVVVVFMVITPPSKQDKESLFGMLGDAEAGQDNIAGSHCCSMHSIPCSSTRTCALCT